MVAGVNRWSGIGNLTADPEFNRGDRPESDRCEFSIAVNEGGRDRDGNEPPPTYLDCVLWGKQAQSASENLAKGRPVYLEGKIEVRTWEDRDTQQKRKAWRIKVFMFRYLDSKPDRGRDRDDRSQGRDRDDRDRSQGRNERDRPRDNRDNEREPRREATPATDFDDLPF